MLMLLVVAIGGAIGTALRYITARFLYMLLGEGFPIGTLAVNVLGSFLVGLLITLLLERVLNNTMWRAFIQIGFLGGYTTFSSFSWETLGLYQQGQFALAILNIILNVSLSLVAVIVGTILARSI